MYKLAGFGFSFESGSVYGSLALRKLGSGRLCPATSRSECWRHDLNFTLKLSDVKFHAFPGCHALVLGNNLRKGLQCAADSCLLFMNIRSGSSEP